MDAQIKKGVLEMCILHMISENEMYGYDIIQQIHGFFPEVTESTIYAILRRLHKDGATDTYQSAGTKGPVRKYYTITPQGLEHLARARADWAHLKSIVEEMGI